MPYFKKLDKENKKNFNDKVDRNSRKSKVTSLLHEASNIIALTPSLSEADKFFSYIPVLGACYQNVPFVRDLTFLLVIIINFLVLITYRYENEIEGPEKVLGLVSVTGKHSTFI